MDQKHECTYDDDGTFCYTHETHQNKNGTCPGFDPINHQVIDGLGETPTQGIADIVRELLDAEHDRLNRDHYDDDNRASCDGCRRNALIRNTLATTIKIERA